MATLSRDTSPEIERLMIELLRKKTTAERIRMADDLTTCVREMVKRSIAQRYPQADEDELRKRFAVVWLGRDWAIRAYGWDPEERGW